MKRTSLYLCLVAAAFMLFVSCDRTPMVQEPERPPAVVHITIRIVQNKIWVVPRVVELRRALKQQVNGIIRIFAYKPG